MPSTYAHRRFGADVLALLPDGLRATLEHPAVYEMLQKGCEVARATAAETLADVKKAMKINYFDDKELIEEQVKRFSQE